MGGKRNARARSRGSGAARLAGAGSALLLATAGVAAYLILGGAHDRKDAAVLPTKVLGTQAVSIVNPGGAGGSRPTPETLIASRPDPAFEINGPSGAQWTSDQMAGGSYIFIYLPNGLCLASGPARHRSSVTLQRCDLAASQRWLRQHLVVGGGGMDYWQLRNMARGQCLSSGNAVRIGETEAVLKPCAASPGATQQVTFLTAS